MEGCEFGTQTWYENAGTVLLVAGGQRRALKAAKDKKLKDSRTKHLLETKDEREAKKAAQEAAARCKKVERAKV